jgi:hypothetical protein
MASCCGHGNELSGSIQGEEILDRVTVSFSRRALLHAVSYEYKVRVKFAPHHEGVLGSGVTAPFII